MMVSDQVRRVMRPFWEEASIALSRRLVQIWLTPWQPVESRGRLAPKLFFEGELFFAELVGEDDEGRVDALVDVDGLLHAFAFIGIALDGGDEIGDAGDGFFDGADELLAGDKGFEPVEGVREDGAVEGVAGAGEGFGVDADGDEYGRELPGVVDVGAVEPVGEGLFGVGLLDGGKGGRLGVEGVVLKVEDAVFLFFRHGDAGEAGGEGVEPHQVFAELGAGAAGGRAGVVELVHEAGGHDAEGGHLLLLEGGALHLGEAHGHVAEDGLADLGALGHELPELVFVELEDL